jgi:FkbM family methyltransferase
MAKASRFTPYVTVENEGRAVVVSTGDRKMAKFFTKGVRTEQRVLHKALGLLESAGHERPGGTFVDAGANIGTSAFAALGEGFSFVVACEPEPENVRLLRTSVALNGLADVVAVREVALSDRAGTGRLDAGSGSRSKARVLAGNEEQSRGEAIEVRLVPLDDLAEEGVFDPARVGMLWLDVEGHEAQVLAGARAILRHAPPLVMELSPKLLRRAGGLDGLPGLLASHYTHVADLRHGEPGPMPVATVRSLIESYAESHTDVLLFAAP